MVAAHQRWTGTNDGPFAGAPATHKRLEFTSTAVLRIDGDLVAEAWDEVDMLGPTGRLSS
jgi:predicted ester cyclase